jgi:uncharacterized protein (DUF1501 family)
MTPIGNHTRRAFLKSVAGFGALGASGPLAMQFAALASASGAQAAASDYKALVCVYLNGGNDHFDTLVPYDTDNYNALAKLRGNIIQPKNTLLALPSSTSQNGLSAALHPGLQNVNKFFKDGRLAILSSVGPLIEPVTRAQLAAGTKLVAPGYGSHNDGNSMWHALGTEGTRYGWAGKMLDSLVSMKNATFASMSVGYYNAFGSGVTTDQFQLFSDGVLNNFAGINQVSYLGSPLGAETLKTLLKQSASDNLLQDAYTSLNRRTLEGIATLQTALNAAKDAYPWTEKRTGTYNSVELYRDNNLLAQMRVVARLLSQRATLNVSRQVFFVELMGFDTHSNQVADHSRLLQQLDVALGYLDDCLGQMGLRDSVMTFTTSEFGRNLPQNGDGTDHGWGGVQFVMGGGMKPGKGGKIYGTLPKIGLNSPDIHPALSTIPTTSVEQVVATLGKWFGVSDSTLSDILPNLKNFSPRYLDFA